MEEGIRVTTKKKSKKLITILLVITGVLGLALIGVAIYFYTIKDSSINTGNNSTTTCGCYYIDPAVSADCGDPRRAFQFETATVSSTQTCKASCATSKLSTNLLNSTTQQDLYQICQLQSITDTRCQSMTITDKDGKVVTGKISADNQLNIEAVFDKEYSNYQFVINNESSDPDVISTNKLTIKKTIKDLSQTTAINIVATGTTSTNEQINSPICRRLIEVQQAGVSTVSSLQIKTRDDSGKTKISDIKISTGNLTSTSNIKVKFTFDNKFTELTMTKGLTVDATTGTIEMVEQDLYTASNFSTSASFAQLNDHTGALAIKAEVYVSDTSIGTATSSVTFATPSDDTTGGDTTTVASNFLVTNTSNKTCVERVTPDNVAQLTIVITNKSTNSQKINSVLDKLPLGFTYIAASSKINGVTVADSGYISIATIGSTQQITVSKTNGWTLSSNQSLTIVFQATAGPTALTGTNKNEVVVTPEQIPADPTTLRTSVNVTVAQDCSNPTKDDDTKTPATGLFDSVIFKVTIGIMIVALGWILYSKPQGQVIVAKLVNSEAFKLTELGTWKIFKPKKYFEETVIRKSQKRK